MQTIKSYTNNRLAGLYPPAERQALLRILAEDICRIPFYKILMDEPLDLSPDVEARLRDAIDRLAGGEPIQYILGETDFRGLKLRVAPGVLIPRPETAELVGWILDDFPSETLRVLDVGTGSGCIALALAGEKAEAEVWGLDISPAALGIARENGESNRLNVQWIEADILDEGGWSQLPSALDCIVSNPPYVMEKERAGMRPNVLEHEPALALFVPDDDPLRYYRAIARLARRKLRTGGWLYFEINEQCGEAMRRLLGDEGFAGITLRQDGFGKDRMIKAQWI